jgi:hypothetical protein
LTNWQIITKCSPKEINNHQRNILQYKNSSFNPLCNYLKNSNCSHVTKAMKKEIFKCFLGGILTFHIVQNLSLCNLVWFNAKKSYLRWNPSTFIYIFSYLLIQVFESSTLFAQLQICQAIERYGHIRITITYGLISIIIAIFINYVCFSRISLFF